MDQGKLIALGTPRELVASLGAEHVVEFARRRRRCRSTTPCLRPCRACATSGATRRTPAPVDLGAAPARCRRCSTLLRERRRALSQLGTHSATLEDVFVALTGRQLRDELEQRVAIHSSS